MAQPQHPISQVRIIGGKWRSRKIYFATDVGVRPTPDRVRETVFNWLMPVIQGARCLDLFASTGAMGFEALSRGANAVVMLDQSFEVTKMLRDNADTLQAEHCRVIQATVPNAVPTLIPPPFDIVFLDPPFHKNLIAPTVNWLEANNILAVNAYIFIEAEKALQPLPVSKNWELLRTKIAGQVGYHLFKKVSSLLAQSSGLEP